MGRALAAADHPSVRRFGRHLAAWVASGVACSIMHDPLTVLAYFEEDLVSWEEADIWMGDDGFADRAPLAGEGAMVRVLLSRRVDYVGARAAIDDPGGSIQPEYLRRPDVTVSAAAAAAAAAVVGGGAGR